jgi:hypothetical protein
MHFIKCRKAEILFLSFVVFLPPLAAAGVTLDVNLKAGGVQKFDITTISKITYTATAPVSMVVNLSDATAKPFDISAIGSVTFGGKPAKSDAPRLSRLTAQLALVATRRNGASASIQFSLNKTSAVHVTLHDLSGRTIRVVADSRFAPGDHFVFWDGTNAAGAKVACGTYVLKITGIGASQAFKFVTVR